MHALARSTVKEIPRTDKIPNMTEYFLQDRLLGIHFKGNGTAILNWGAFRPLEGSEVLTWARVGSHKRFGLTSAFVTAEQET